ncbi:hypothetical protein OQA88_4555 [Cercophora sp. LCS_1]
MLFPVILFAAFLLEDALALAGLARRAQNVIIGYRTCSEEQARRYNKQGTLTDDGNQISTQIGMGVYTTPDAGGWKGSQDSWYCVILADSDALDRVSKVWVPETYSGNQLWYRNDAIDSYIQNDINQTWDPAKTLRMSIMSGGPKELQLVIPPGLLNGNGGAMGIVAICEPTLDSLPSQTVDYDNWQDNIGGSRTDPYPDSIWY